MGDDMVLEVSTFIDAARTVYREVAEQYKAMAAFVPGGENIAGVYELVASDMDVLLEVVNGKTLTQVLAEREEL